MSRMVHHGSLRLFCAQAQQAGDPGKLLHETPIVKPKNLITASQTLLTGSITSMGLCENTTALPLPTTALIYIPYLLE